MEFPHSAIIIGRIEPHPYIPSCSSASMAMRCSKWGGRSGSSPGFSLLRLGRGVSQGIPGMQPAVIRIHVSCLSGRVGLFGGMTVYPRLRSVSIFSARPALSFAAAS